ncbi:MAG: hypothetical protein QUS11_03765 [Candidatus Fermentibacter sp.]|nr:hypothetical protein [Candidatus Fermentibacter sp.]
MIPAASLGALLLASFSVSPADSCRKLAGIAEIPEEAILFAELAARQGGDGPILFASLLEAAGRFEEAASAYGIALGGAEDPATRSWLSDRMAGSVPFDTLLVLTAGITNLGSSDARDLTVVMPLPRPHPPCQSLTMLYGPFRRDGGSLLAHIPVLAPGETVELPVMLHIVQSPHTFRPLPGSLGRERFDDILAIAAGVGMPDSFTGTGPCLDMAVEFMEEARKEGIRAGVEGGLVRRGDSLVFHAWNVLLDGIPGLPVDPLLFRTDSLRAIGHCPCDVIPLWDLGAACGHELSVYHAGREADIGIALSASFAGADRSGILFALLESAGAGRLPFIPGGR